MEVIRVQEIGVIGRSITAIAAVEHAIRIHVLEACEARRGHLVTGNALNRLQRLQIKPEVVVVHHNQVGPVSAAHYLHPNPVHVALTICAGHCGAAVSGRVVADVAPKIPGCAIDAAYSSGAGRIRNEQLQTADLLPTARGSIGVDIRGEVVHEGPLGIGDAGLQEVDYSFFTQYVIPEAFYPLVLTVLFPVSSAYLIKQAVRLAEIFFCRRDTQIPRYM
jgi:hypothetical protein